MKNKLINKIIIYTLIVFGISSFSCFPKSYSKYIKEETPVRFYVGIDKLYMGEVENLSPTSSSTYEYAHYLFMFDRSQTMKEYDKIQELTITIKQPACEFTNITSKGTISKTGNVATITYSSSYEDTIKVGYKCPVNNITRIDNELEVLSSSFEVYEKFMPENTSYLYLKGNSVKTLLSDYKFIYPKPSDKLTFDDRNLVIPKKYVGKYDAFINWIIGNYGASFDNKYDVEILKYVKKVYNNDTDITDLSKNLKGLTVTYDENSESYIYRIDDNFLGYARTYYAYVGPQIYLKAMFSNNNLTDIESNEIFKEYLQEYTTYNDGQIDIIMNYISHYGSLNYVINSNGNNKVPGIEYDFIADEIQVEDIIYYLAHSYTDKKIYIKYGLGGEMRFLYTTALPLAYSNLSVDMLNTLKSNTNILKTVMKNNATSNTLGEFSNYFVIKNESIVDNKIISEHVLVNIYSMLDESMNCVEIIDLGSNATDITITENNNKLEVSITLDNKDVNVAKTNLTDIVSSIDNYFSTSYSNYIVDSLFTSSSTNESMTSVIDGNNITITYSLL